MQENYTLWQRITAGTPLFFKRLQAFGIALAGLGSSLTQVHSIPEKLTTILISSGTAIIIIAQFAVKESEIINTQTHDDIK